MRVTVETPDRTVTITDSDDMDAFTALALWRDLMLGLGFHPASVDDAVCDAADLIRERREAEKEE